jgi:hypothetical protein
LVVVGVSNTSASPNISSNRARWRASVGRYYAHAVEKRVDLIDAPQ